MSKSAIPLAVACLLAGGLLASPGRAESISRSCQTVNDWAICVRASGARSAVSLSCRTVDDRTICSGPEGLRCEASAGRPVCRGGSGVDVEILPVRRHTDRMTLPLELDLDED